MMRQAKDKSIEALGLESISIQRAPLNGNDSATELRKEDLVADHLTGGDHGLVSVPVVIPNGGYVITARTLTSKTYNICVKGTYTTEQLKE